MNFIKNMLPAFQIMEISYFHGYVRCHSLIKVPLDWSEDKLLDRLNAYARRDSYNFPKIFRVNKTKKMSTNKLKKTVINGKSLMELEALSDNNTFMYDKFPRLLISTNMNAIMS